MEISSEQLEALLEMLKEWGVEEFEGFGFHVRFSLPQPVAAPPVEVTEFPRETPEARSVWENEKLWPGGKPPSFPK